ncbi:hypothetical protein JQR84_06185 [Pseudomonas luteola]|uniref:hypothetical protein n=1 Tax=Pseudomonas TaxID=286 RepID=UPI003DA05449
MAFQAKQLMLVSAVPAYKAKVSRQLQQVLSLKCFMLFFGANYVLIVTESTKFVLYNNKLRNRNVKKRAPIKQCLSLFSFADECFSLMIVGFAPSGHYGTLLA